MANDPTTYEPGADDGFSGPLNSGRLLKGTFLKWSDATHWVDRDGLPPPSPLLVIAINAVLQKWKDGKAEVISAKPLPDPEQLNAAIPENEWERGIDGELRKPWAHVVVVYLDNDWRPHRLRRTQGSGDHDAGFTWQSRNAACKSRRTADENRLRPAAAPAF